MGIPAAAWFVIAAVAFLLGGLLLLNDRMRGASGDAKDRRRWAALRGWAFAESDPVLPSKWRYGTIHQGGPGVARDVVTGSIAGVDGRRQVFVFDHEQAGRLSSVVVAVQCRITLRAAMELRLPSAPLPEDAGLDLLEPVGRRYAFVSDAFVLRPLITPRLVQASDAVGDDIELLWAEDAWVVAAAPLGSPPERLQDLLSELADVALALEHAGEDGNPAPHHGGFQENPYDQ